MFQNPFSLSPIFSKNKQWFCLVMFSCSCWLSVQKGTIWSFVVPVLLIAVVRSKTWSAKAASPESCNILSIVHPVEIVSLSYLFRIGICSCAIHRAWDPAIGKLYLSTLQKTCALSTIFIYTNYLCFMYTVVFKWSIECQLYHYS